MKEGFLKRVTPKVSWRAGGRAAVERTWILVVQISDEYYGPRSKDEKMGDLGLGEVAIGGPVEPIFLAECVVWWESLRG